MMYIADTPVLNSPVFNAVDAFLNAVIIAESSAEPIDLAHGSDQFYNP